MSTSGLTALDKLMAKIDHEPSSEAPRPDNSLIVIRGDQATEKPLRWMWKPYLPSGKLVHFGGNSSQAKSPVTVDLAAHISTGAHWPDGTANTIGARSVILLNIEDDLEDTILPRFRLAGGDKSKLYYVKGTRVASATDETQTLERNVALVHDTEKLAELARKLPDLGLIVIDPITNYLGGLKMNAEEDTQSASGNSGALNLPKLLGGGSDGIQFILNVTASSTPTSLDVYLQHSPDQGTTWYDFAHFAQVGAVSTAIQSLSWARRSQALITANTAVVTTGDAALAAATVINGPIVDNYFRAKWVIVGTSYTFSLIAIQDRD